MVRITQPKIAGLEPRWAAFAGFSLLFDNPDGAAACGRERELYARLESTLDAIGHQHLAKEFLFCPLPPLSYHVTVWDGINAENIASVPAALRAEWAAFLQAIPDASRAPPASMAVVRNSRLARGPREPTLFRFDELAVWGNQVLVARLLPVDAAAVASLADLCHAREELSAASVQILGVSPSPGYAPHVTLGYFANEDGGERAGALLAGWNVQFQERLAGVTIRFASIGVYAFPDMANFFRR